LPLNFGLPRKAANKNKYSKIVFYTSAVSILIKYERKKVPASVIKINLKTEKKFNKKTIDYSQGYQGRFTPHFSGVKENQN